MKRTIAIVGLALLATIFLVMLASKADADTIVVDVNGNGDYTTIQDGIDNASDGDTIYVWNGTYNEVNTIATDNITIVGNGTSQTILDSDGTGNKIFDISSNNTTLKDMALTDSGLIEIAIYLGDGLNNLTVDNVEIYNVEKGFVFGDDVENISIIGVYVHDLSGFGSQALGIGSCTNMLVDGCVFDGTSILGSVTNGIFVNSVFVENGFVLSAYGDWVMDNITGCDCGIGLSGDDTLNAIVTNNTIWNGDMEFFGDGNIYFAHNYIQDNNSGLCFYTEECLGIIEHNTFIGNYSDASTWVFFVYGENYEAGDFVVRHNTFTEGEYIVWIDLGTTNVTMYNNTIEDGVEAGIYMESDSHHNTFYNNNFQNNTIHIDDQGVGGNTYYLDMPVGGNYYDNYTTPDQNSDGIVDYPIPIASEDKYPWTTPYGWLSPPEPTVQNNDTGEMFWTIQDAIDDIDTLENHTIRVWSGTYFEGVIVTKNNLTFIGNGTANTTINGTGKNACFYISGYNNTVISGFKLLQASDNTPCVYMRYSLGGEVYDCNFTMYSISRGIILNTSSAYTFVHNNTLFGGSDGMITPGTLGYINITDNLFVGHSNYGIKFSSNDNGRVENNTFRECYYGFEDSGSDDIWVYGNTFENCTRTATQVVLANTGTYINNTWKNNRMGVDLNLPFLTNGNTFYSNSFINNTIHASDNGTNTVWNSSIQGNYWDTWTWPDIDANGIVDLQYNISGGAGSADYLPIADPIVVVANGTVPIETYWCQNVTVTANGSTGGDWYHWDWGDGTTTNTTEIWTTHHYTTPGTKTIILTVGNQTGITATKTLGLEVSFETTYDSAEYATISFNEILMAILPILFLLLITKQMLNWFQETIEENLRK